MSCQYKDQCPSYSGWCNGPKQDFSKCVEFLITAYENEKKRMMPNEYQKLAIRTCSIPYDQKKDMTTSRLWQKISLISGEHFSKTA